MTTPLYTKIGRRYLPWGTAEDWRHDADLMKAGTFRLVFCPGDGSRRYSYDVTPDTAGFAAAAEIAIQAMEQAIKARAIAKPQVGVSRYTKRQLAIIKQFRVDMAAAGALVPSHWEHASAREIAEAGVKAVRDWARNQSKPQGHVSMPLF